MRFDYRHTRCYEIVWIFQFKAFKSCWTHNNNWCAIFDSLRKIMLGKFGILPAQHHRDTIHCHRDPSVAVPSIESPLEPNDINQIAKKNFSLRLRTKSVFPPFLLWSECLLVVGFFFYFHSCPFRFHNILCDLKCIYLFIFSYIFIETERRSFCFRWFRNNSPRRTYTQRTHKHIIMEFLFIAALSGYMWHTERVFILYTV